MVATNLNEHTATSKLARFGKVDTDVNLESLKRDFETFYAQRGENVGELEDKDWADYVSLIERLHYRGHFVKWCPTECEWHIEQVRGGNWIPVNLAEFFNFAGD